MPLIELEQESLSPRLAWLRQHRLHTARDILPRGFIGPYDTKPWRCSNAGRTLNGFGDDEIEATMEYAHMLSIEHWMEAELREQVSNNALHDAAGAMGMKWGDNAPQRSSLRVLDWDEA